MLIERPVFQVAFKCSVGFTSMDMSGKRIYLGFPRIQVFALETSAHSRGWLCKYIKKTWVNNTAPLLAWFIIYMFRNSVVSSLFWMPGKTHFVVTVYQLTYALDLQPNYKAGVEGGGLGVVGWWVGEGGGGI